MPTTDIIALKNVRLSFAKLFDPRSFTDKDGNKSAPRFESSFLLDPSDKAHKAVIKQIVDAAREALLEEFNGHVPVDVEACFGFADASPITLGQDEDGDDVEWRGKKKKYDGYEGMFYISSSNKTRPTVVDRDRTPLVEADGKPYSGCFVNATITLWTQDNQWGKRVNANLRAVQFVRDGDAFGVQPANAEDEFDVLDGEDGGDDDSFLD